MRYLDFKNQLNNFVVFSLKDIRKLDPSFYNRRLNEWQNRGYIKMVRRGYYIFSNLKLTEEVLFLIANKIYSPSYVSLESALSFYGLIPEGVFSVTSVSTKKTGSFSSLGNFSYRHIKSELFFGYNLIKLSDQVYKIADIEKVVLDYLYLNPAMSDLESLIEWRFNMEEFMAQADMRKFKRYLRYYNSQALNKRVDQFLKQREFSDAKS